MSPHIILILSYILFIWLVVLHTFEEISCDIMGLELGPIKLTKNRYLLGASAISTINLGTLASYFWACPQDIILVYSQPQ